MLLTQVVWLSALCAMALGCPTIVSRSQWGARLPKSRVWLRTRVPVVIIHHTVGNRCTSLATCSKEVRGIQNYHMDSNGGADIGYNFLIGEDGRVYEGRGWSTMGAHAKGWNDKSLGFSFLGSFTNRAPSAAALNAAKSLIQCAISKGFLSRSYTLKGHRNVNPTSCPGNALYNIIRMWPRFKVTPRPEEEFGGSREQLPLKVPAEVSRAGICSAAEGARQDAQRTLYLRYGGKRRPSERRMLLTRVVWLSALCAMALGCPTIVSRSEWGARPPRNRVSLQIPVPFAIIHHTEGNYCSSQTACSNEVKGIQNYHMDSNGWADIGYNFLIGEDGRVYEGRGWSTMGAHAQGWNDDSLGFCFLGSFTNRVPNTAALNAAKSLIQCAVSKGFLSSSYILKGHRNVNPTDCPGNALYNLIRTWPRFQA
ncbi:peptidoglycan recognition protein 3-like [Emydura macquarii macquarii]|uniref:peptidoglycan recognition protein 3-like n=1 Tax=Emydura macquarii macquarii TaxID=1129001 RepID=UPI00352A4535